MYTPTPPNPESREALVIPDSIWARALDGLGLAPGATLGFPSDQMAQYGRDMFVTRPVATLFRDVRAIPRTSGKLSDTILEAAKDPSELVRIAFGLTDAVQVMARKMCRRAGQLPAPGFNPIGR